MISVRDSKELRAAVLALKTADRDLRSSINRATVATMNPVWRDLVTRNATWKMHDLVLAKGARIKAGNPPVAMAAQSRRRLKGGLVPNQDWQAFEFGADRATETTYQRQNETAGGMHSVTRHTRRQVPAVHRAGRVAYPALADLAPRLASLWVQLIVRKYAEAAERT